MSVDNPVRSTVRIGVIQFPGTNCARETALAIERAGMEAVHFLWNGDRRQLRDLDGYVLAGGFSYEDRSRSGVIAALDPVMEVVAEQNEAGKPVLGICNGAQILLEAGIVPGIPAAVALTTNRRETRGRILGTGFYNAWVYVRAEKAGAGAGAFTELLEPEEVLHIPAAHAEGRFVMDRETLRVIEAEGLVAFRYTDELGRVVPEFPVNPNGSVANIAALTNRVGTALAIMPHPERTTAGDGIFRSLHRYLETRREKPSRADAPRGASRRRAEEGLAARVPPFRREPAAEEVVVELIITDNAAVSVENALRQRGISAAVTRRVHWELVFEEGLSGAERQDLLRRIHATGELYNENKERLLARPDAASPASGRECTFLVREREDVTGTRIRQVLADWFHCRGLRSLNHGVLWTIHPEGDAAGIVDAVLATAILANPVSQELVRYE